MSAKDFVLVSFRRYSNSAEIAVTAVSVHHKEDWLVHVESVKALFDAGYEAEELYFSANNYVQMSSFAQFDNSVTVSEIDAGEVAILHKAFGVAKGQQLRFGECLHLDLLDTLKEQFKDDYGYEYGTNE